MKYTVYDVLQYGRYFVEGWHMALAFILVTYGALLRTRNNRSPFTRWSSSEQVMA